MTQSPREGRAPDGTHSVSTYRMLADGSGFGFVRANAGQLLLHVVGASEGFRGEGASSGLLCPLIPENARALMERFEWLRPQRMPADRPSFGFGDRLGLATSGHIRGLPSSSSIFPILAQQSVRENARTGRTFADVLADAVFGAFREGYESGFGADADHLKEIDDALEAARLGYTFFTCDPGDHVVATEAMPVEEIASRFNALDDAADLTKRYSNRSFGVGENQVLHFSEGDLHRAAVKYRGAINHAARMYEALKAECGADFDYEVSVDETEEPTSPLEHLFVALELRRRGVDYVSLAPRFVGAMEKGVDWRGDFERFSTDLEMHATIAESVKGYRLSLHSGSDKFSLYPLFSRMTRGRCHVKTAGTSYLVALEVVARHRPDLFRKMAGYSLKAFADDKATYHISADPARIPPIAGLSDAELVDLIEAHDSRQVLHVAYGSILQSEYVGEFRSVLAEHEEDHFTALARHLGRHVEGLLIGDLEVEAHG
ncbi:tagaturonate epimerase family protein [Candidatus Bipolaricaulota bacterium]